jgi:lysophospholipase L1-like esterase
MSTWTPKVNGNIAYAADINDLQTEKVDRDGAIPMTGTLTLNARSVPGNSGTTGAIVFAGDSLTVGYGGTTPWTGDITPPSGTAVSNVAHGGDQATDALILGWTAVDPLFRPRAALNIVILWIGYNDISLGVTPAVVEANIAQYCRERHAVGWRVLIATLPSASGEEADRKALNALLLDNWQEYADGIVDLAANATIGAHNACANGTYFMPDGVHMIDAGYAIAKSIMQTAINNLANYSLNNILLSTFRGADSDGSNIWIGGGGRSSVGAFGDTNKGSFNVGVGINALLGNTTGQSNVAVGVNALASNLGGDYNSALGMGALLYNSAGYANVAVGLNAGRYITGGSSGNETSNCSVYIGHATRAGADGNTNEIVIGQGTTGEGSNSVVLGNANITKTVLRGGIICGAAAVAATERLSVIGVATAAGIYFNDQAPNTTTCTLYRSGNDLYWGSTKLN